VSPRNVIAALLVATYWAALALSTQFSFDALFNRFGDLGPYLAGVVLAFVVGIYVGRWTVLLAAASAPLALAALQLAGYMASYHEATSPLSGWGWWLALSAVPLGLGVLIRKRGLTPSPRQPAPL
jgi:peptidoglycan/LPS O-acetylase OafA/YrhL